VRVRFIISGNPRPGPVERYAEDEEYYKGKHLLRLDQEPS